MAKDTCSVDTCELPVSKRKWCERHYRNWLQYGDPINLGTPLYPCREPECGKPAQGRGWCLRHYLMCRPMQPPCSVDGCDRDQHGKGFCKAHGRRLRNHGDVFPNIPLEYGVRISKQLPPFETRFWAKVDRVNGPVMYEHLGQCWPWTGRKTGQYGRFAGMRAHRVSLELSTGKPLGDLLALHRCDWPPCCRPSHIYAGTASDNGKDMADRARSCWGERNLYAKLSAEQVQDIRKLYESGDSYRDLATTFSVTPKTIRNIIGGKTWRHLAVD